MYGLFILGLKSCIVVDYLTFIMHLKTCVSRLLEKWWISV